MKRLLAVIGLLLVPVVLVAQQPPTFWVERATIPFQFVVNGTTTLPPGDYKFSWNACGILIVHATHNDKLFAVGMGTSIDRAATGKPPVLTFHNVGDAYFLADVSHPQAGKLVMGKTVRQHSLEREASARREVTVAGQ